MEANWDDLWQNEQGNDYNKIPGVIMRTKRIIEEIRCIETKINGSITIFCALCGAKAWSKMRDKRVKANPHFF